MMKLAYLSLGSNLGHREGHLEEALKLITILAGDLERISHYYESEPWGYSSENRFCNCCVSLRTRLAPLPLLEILLGIEKQMGRERTGKDYSDRIIDIDLLLFGDILLDHPRLKLPHPAMGNRRFVLVPLAEIAPGLIHPVSGITITTMLQICDDHTRVTLLHQR
jgi:2-amino-4-hydroxy-6-hydroxymethyldihydropteridine diphosphokinase